MKRPTLIATTTAAAIAVFATAAVARPQKTIATGKARGDFAIAQATGSIERPRTIRVKVTSRPRQKVSVAWTMVCLVGSGAGSKSGQFTARTTVNRKLRKPSRRAHDCTVSANAQLAEGGSIKIKLTG
jgi:hypothetical protein